MEIDGVELYTWKEHLVRCPSQAEYYFYSEGIYYCIYLRWRHLDPWEVTLIKMGDSPNDYSNPNQEWRPLPLSKDYKEEEIEELKKETIEVVKLLHKFQSPFKKYR